ncbi:hypothetical protein [Microbacterium arborescens]
MAPDNPSRQTTGWWARKSNRVLVFVAVGYVILGGLLLIYAPALLLQNWLPGSTVREQGKLLGAAAQIVLFGLGGVIAIVGVTLSVARHQEELEAQDRDRDRLVDDRAKEAARQKEWEEERRAEVDRELRARFASTVDMLTSQSAIKRSAAFYALGALADDWANHDRRDEMQVCIDVMCGYLRAPWPDVRRQGDERAVREAGYDVIRSHLTPPHTRNSWAEATLNLSGAEFLGRVSFNEIYLHGDGVLNLTKARFFSRADLQLRGATVTDGAVIDLRGAVFESGAMLSGEVTTLRDRGRVTFVTAKVRAGATVSFDDSVIVDAGIYFGRCEIAAGAWVELQGAKLHGKGTISFVSAKIEGEIDLSGAELTGDARVSFPGARVIRDDGVVLRGATIDGSGPVTLPDGRQLTPAGPRRTTASETKA